MPKEQRGQGPMDIVSLIDIETQLSQDTTAEIDVLRRREQKIGKNLELVGRSDSAILVDWIEQVRQQEPSGLYPGKASARALRWLRILLTLFGLSAGWGLSEALLYYDGQHPVNVLHFLAVVVGLQLGLLLLLLPGLLLPNAIAKLPVLRELRSLLRWALLTMVRRAVGAAGGAAPGARVDAWTAALRRLSGRRGLYRSIEPWLLLGTSQYFGFAFNIGVALGCLRLIAFSDLAFAWSTTLQGLDADFLFDCTQILALPWSWTGLNAAPTLQLVQETHYARLASAYLAAEVAADGQRAIDVLRVGGWWPFLIMSTLVYGLLPRFLVLVGAGLRTRHNLKNLPLDDVDIRRVLERLRHPVLATQALTAEPANTDAKPQPQTQLAQAEVGDSNSTCRVVYWRDLPHNAAFSQRLEDLTGRRVEAEYDAGGADMESEKATLRELSADSKTTTAVVVVAEAWEAPDKATLRFLRDLRQSVGERCLILVAIVVLDEAGTPQPPENEDSKTWRDRLASLSDPYLGLEPWESKA